MFKKIIFTILGVLMFAAPAFGGFRVISRDKAEGFDNYYRIVYEYVFESPGDASVIVDYYGPDLNFDDPYLAKREEAYLLRDFRSDGEDADAGDDDEG